MRRLGRVDKNGRRAGGGKCRGNLARDMPRFADAGYDQLTTAGKNRFARGNECVIQRALQLAERIAPRPHDITAPAQQIVRIE